MSTIEERQEKFVREYYESIAPTTILKLYKPSRIARLFWKSEIKRVIKGKKEEK